MKFLYKHIYFQTVIGFSQCNATYWRLRTIMPLFWSEQSVRVIWADNEAGLEEEGLVCYYNVSL